VTVTTPRTAAEQITRAAQRSSAELRRYGRQPVRYRMHSLDAETIIAAVKPAEARRELLKFLGLDVVLDDSMRLGHPVAEFDA
jgi:hypothetical protein